jgi:hypothetical protein
MSPNQHAECQNTNIDNNVEALSVMVGKPD